MKIFDRYFSKNNISFQPDFPDTLSLIVVVPVFNDPDIFNTLASLAECRLEGCSAGVIVVVNHPVDCAEELRRKNRLLFTDLLNYVRGLSCSGLSFHIVSAFDMAGKWAGVGLARKIGMDAAAWYFYKQDRPDGIIVSLDADTWVEKNYLLEISTCFAANAFSGITIGYAHRFPADPEEKAAIMKYELYLRYYRMALAYCNHPYAYSCLGSAFAVRATDYAAQGGMNKRQAGEDFYFIQKLIATGRIFHLNTTKVYPSGRISDRTPFGTGRVVQQIVTDKGDYRTYNFGAFRVLKSFFACVPAFFRADSRQVQEMSDRQHSSLQLFLAENNFFQMLEEVNGNCASQKLFVKRFYDNFNAFRILKYMNFVHPRYFEKQSIECAARELLTGMGQNEIPENLEALLTVFRQLDV